MTCVVLDQLMVTVTITVVTKTVKEEKELMKEARRDISRRRRGVPGGSAHWT